MIFDSRTTSQCQTRECTMTGAEDPGPEAGPVIQEWSKGCGEGMQE